MSKQLNQSLLELLSALQANESKEVLVGEGYVGEREWEVFDEFKGFRIVISDLVPRDQIWILPDSTDA